MLLPEASTLTPRTLKLEALTKSVIDPVRSTTASPGFLTKPTSLATSVLLTKVPATRSFSPLARSARAPPV